MKRVLLLLSVPLLGCAVGPDYQAPPLAAPSAWTDRAASDKQSSNLDRWWRRFKDPMLDQLVDAALHANASVAQAVAKLREARASLVQEQAALYPTLDGSGQATRSRQYIGADTGGLGIGNNAQYFASNGFQAGFDASYEIDIFGGKRRGVESSDASLEATRADLGDTVLTMLGDVAHYYVEARGYQARIAVAKDTLASRTDSWRLARAKAQGGTGTELDAVQAEAAMKSATASIPPLEYDFRAAVNRLAVLTGQSPQDVLDKLRAPRAVPRLAGTIRPDPPVVALARRPDIRAAERRIAEANADIGVAEADRLPAVTLAGSLGVNSGAIRSLFNSSANVWSFGPEFSVPIFDAGKRAAKVDAKIATRNEKVAAWQATVRSAIEDAENGLVALDREWAHNAALRRSVDAYGEALKISRAKYQAGLATFLDVLDADRSLASERDSLAQSDVALAVDAIALYKALGGGWQDAVEGSGR
jgi:multidrug efflux system outer membrane protein